MHADFLLFPVTSTVYPASPTASISPTAKPFQIVSGKANEHVPSQCPA